MRILYIDDSEDERMLFTKAAEQHGVECKALDNVKDFVTEFESGKYDVALIDYIMPTIDGAFVANLVTRNKTKVFILTGHDRAIIDNLIKIPIAGVVAKDNNYTQIFKTIGILDER